jgi:hypothetical protein
MDIYWVKEQVVKGNYQFKLHALERASTRGIDPIEIKEALLSGKIIEDYPEDKRGHSCLVQGKTLTGRDIHAVCGKSYDIMIYYGSLQYTNLIQENGLIQKQGG